MPTVAEQLRQAREAQKLDPRQLAEITKIKSDHLLALEAGQFDGFIAPVYIRGFVRTYAKTLKLNVAQVMIDLDAELGQSAKFRDPAPLVPPSGPLDFVMLQVSKLNWRMVVAAIAAVIALLVVAFVFRGPSKVKVDPLKNLGPGMYKPRPDQSGELLPLPAPTAPSSK